jgi:hypothetical protein
MKKKIDEKRTITPRWVIKFTSEKRGDEIKKKIFSSETTEPISTKLC